ncbi:LuxR C-terminal-related transcriptional regulator [Labilibaculum sp.]|uniref:LuxR C-terminal-related transcriptional regulator n=1 Tax=Labilibaculum sp. TaxID=2060723 RepID=UPI003564A5A8
MEKSTKILITYDQCMMAEGLEAILSKQNKHAILPLRKNYSDIEGDSAAKQAEIIVVEISAISMDHVEYISHLHQSFPSQKILIVSDSPSRELLQSIFYFIDGYLLRSCSSEQLILAIHEVMETGKYFCSKLLPIIFEKKRKNKHNINLTFREKEVLTLLFTAKGNQEIANTLNISTTTVRTHIKNIRHKFGNITQIQMMRYACDSNSHNGITIPLCPNCRFFCKKNTNNRL